ncbi:hypothetical protein E2C01_049960 [Portunus trituberculatus]|uniref:Uncharacterized protein n=1 Tax=Portunus trituberculatus TaxID=210409 RepID=A0A5B7G7Q5_PORTR|nr:hypothetical protein [Portunus trituberculatus]
MKQYLSRGEKMGRRARGLLGARGDTQPGPTHINTNIANPITNAGEVEYITSTKHLHTLGASHRSTKSHLVGGVPAAWRDV